MSYLRINIKYNSFERSFARFQVALNEFPAAIFLDSGVSIRQIGQIKSPICFRDFVSEIKHVFENAELFTNYVFFFFLMQLIGLDTVNIFILFL